MVEHELTPETLLLRAHDLSLPASTSAFLSEVHGLSPKGLPKTVLTLAYTHSTNAGILVILRQLRSVLNPLTPDGERMLRNADSLMKEVEVRVKAFAALYDKTALFFPSIAAQLEGHSESGRNEPAETKQSNDLREHGKELGEGAADTLLSAPQAVKHVAEIILPKSTAAPKYLAFIVSPISGKIVALKVTKGDRVEPKTTLFVLSAMNMEMNVDTPIAGVVKNIHLPVGSDVAAMELVVEIEFE
ncbi:Carboxylase domain protein [Aphelenchoides fujianensis]|nr:Carboxylase domain protein [Aphelenchoides fujianensis]